MAKNTMGQFISALRKANGMTQQDVADRLNVSNKAVSRWERDECSPDISLIPAIAEMFGVSCDELLKGERISNILSEEKKELKVEKQIKSLINRTLSGFKTMTVISVAVAFSGFIFMFGITYGFYRSVIGFAVMSVFEICAAVISILALNKAKTVKTDNELFDKADVLLIQNFNQKLGSRSFLSLFCVISLFIAALPIAFPVEIFQLFMRNFTAYSGIENGVLAFESYVSVYLPEVIIIIVLIYLVCKRPYIAWVSGQKLPKRQNLTENTAVNKMSILQIVLTLLACIMFLVAPYFDNNPNKISALFSIISVLGLVFLAASIVCFAVFIIRSKENRKAFMLIGIRNICLIPSAILISQANSASWTSYSETESAAGDWARSISWEKDYILLAIGYIIIVFAVFSFINTLAARRLNNK